MTVFFQAPAINLSGIGGNNCYKQKLYQNKKPNIFWIFIFSQKY